MHVGVGVPLQGPEGEVDDLGLRGFLCGIKHTPVSLDEKQVKRREKGKPTFARMANSVIIGPAGCSSESSTRVSGLAPSRWFSSFWKSSCWRWRACSCAEGAIPDAMVCVAVGCRDESGLSSKS